MKSVALIMVMLAAAMTLGVSSALAGEDAHTYYVALGDSLATGAQPAASGETAALRAANGMNHGYVDVLYALARAQMPQLQLKNFACGGETTTSMIAGGGRLGIRCGYVRGSQLEEAVAFLEARPGRVAFITIDIGANDFLLGELPAVAANLPVILSRLRAAAGPDVPIVGMNYYDPFVAPVWFATHSLAAVAAEAAAVGALNDFFEGIYAGFGIPVADVESAFQLQDLSLVNGVPLNVLRACEWTWICAAGDIHANDAGHAAIAQAFAGLVLSP